MNTYIEIDKFDDKVFIDVFVGTTYESKFFVRDHILMRGDLTPFTYDGLDDYFNVYIDGVGSFQLDQKDIDSSKLIIAKVLDVDTISMSNWDIRTELRKI